MDSHPFLDQGPLKNLKNGTLKTLNLKLKQNIYKKNENLQVQNQN